MPNHSRDGCATFEGLQIFMSQPVRFAILGAAKIARTVAPFLHSTPESQLVGIASRNTAKAADFAAEYSIPKTYGSYQDALDDPDIDAVYVPLPPALHLEWTCKAAQAGKHVLCEKPLARNAAEVRQMQAESRRHKVVLLDGVMWYHTQRAARIRDTVRSQQLGDIRQITAAFTFCWDVMPMENLRLHRSLGGGSLLDLGWYCVGAALWLLDRQPTEVFAKAQWNNDVDTRMNAFLWFEDGPVVTVECGFDAVRRRWLEVTGTRQTLFCDDFTRPWNAAESSFRTIDSEGRRQVVASPERPQEESMIAAFCDLIRRSEISHEWLKLSQRTQAVCDALDQSARENRTLSIAPETAPAP